MALVARGATATRAQRDPRATYETRCLRERKAGGPVALVLSLSGPVIPDAGLEAAKLPVDGDATVYELRLTSDTPNPDFLRTLADLQAFQAAHRRFLAQITGQHAGLQELAVFPAVPVPVAISLGMCRLPKVHPALAVYDRTQDGWKHVLDVMQGSQPGSA